MLTRERTRKGEGGGGGGGGFREAAERTHMMKHLLSCCGSSHGYKTTRGKRNTDRSVGLDIH